MPATGGKIRVAAGSRPETRGVALVIVLLVIATLAGLTIAFSEDAITEASLAGYARDGHRARQAALSGVNLALALLDRDKDRSVDSLREDWARFGAHVFPSLVPEEISFSGRIVDECGKLNLNSLRDAKGKIDETRAGRLRRLFDALHVDPDPVNPLLDWLDADDVERMEGAETFYYQGLPHPYAAANGPFRTPGQVFLVKGMPRIRSFGGDPEKRILWYLTVYGGGKVNINTAPAEVLESLDEEMDAATARSILDYRQEEDFRTVSDLMKVPGMDESVYKRIKGAVTVKSDTYSIEIRVACQEAVAEVRAVAVRDGKISKLIYWQVL